MSEEQNHIIVGCVNWERDSQEKLYRLYADLLYKSCRLYARNTDEASDFLHDAFIHIYKNIHLYKEQGNLAAWLKRVTVNCCLQQLRKSNRVNRVEESREIQDMLYAEDREEDAGISFEQVLHEINQLPSRASLVIKLYVIEGWTHAEIAEELNISIGTSKSQLNYARNLIKARCQ